MDTFSNLSQASYDIEYSVNCVVGVKALPEVRQVTLVSVNAEKDKTGTIKATKMCNHDHNKWQQQDSLYR